MEHFDWPLVDRFLNRTNELARLADWFEDPTGQPLAVLGRRRVGKSWLLRRFAHGKPAVVLVAERLAEGMQLDRFARQLAPLLGVEPRLGDVTELFRVLLHLGRTERITVVVDEFPYLLPSTTAETERVLSRIQAVLEEEAGHNQTRLILSGSVVSQMESLFAERSPLHGRLQRFELAPMSYEEATPFLTTLDPVERFERYAVTGGAARYLNLLGVGPLRTALVRNMLGPDTPLWNEGRSVVEQELRQPAAYFGILQLLSSGDKELNELAQAVRSDSSVIAKYLSTLTQMRLVTRVLPLGAADSSRQGNWHLADPFLQFWFRFVFPYQADIEGGLPADRLFDTEIAPLLNEHVSHQFEAWARSHVRVSSGATNVGAWWGPAVHSLRRTGGRTSEEIDIVGRARGKVTVIGEAKWTNKLMPIAVLDDLRAYKLPAIEQSGLKLAANPAIYLYSRSGYDLRLVAAASADNSIHLIDVKPALENPVR